MPGSARSWSAATRLRHRIRVNRRAGGRHRQEVDQIWLNHLRNCMIELRQFTGRGLMRRRTAAGLLLGLPIAFGFPAGVALAQDPSTTVAKTPPQTAVTAGSADK